MLVYKDYITFTILGEEIHLISDETSYGHSTVAEFNDRYHYINDELPNISTAIFAWQEVNGRDLTSDELHQVMVDNQLISAGI